MTSSSIDVEGSLHSNSESLHVGIRPFPTLIYSKSVCVIQIAKLTIGWVFQKSVTPRKTEISGKFLNEFSRICQCGLREVQTQDILFVDSEFEWSDLSKSIEDDVIQNSERFFVRSDSFRQWFQMKWIGSELALTLISLIHDKNAERIVIEPNKTPNNSY